MLAKVLNPRIAQASTPCSVLLLQREHGFCAQKQTPNAGRKSKKRLCIETFLEMNSFR